MSSRSALTLIALASATFALGAPAEAGGGVRLNFGGPLGTFVATPTPGYGGSSQSAHKPAPKIYTARRAPSGNPTVAERKSKSEPRIVPVAYSSSESKPKALPITSASNETPGLLSRTLTLDSLPRAEAVRTLPPSETIVALDAAGDSATASKAQAPKPTAKIAEAGPATCRKFIPAVGVTVTVPCN